MESTDSSRPHKGDKNRYEQQRSADRANDYRERSRDHHQKRIHNDYKYRPYQEEDDYHRKRRRRHSPNRSRNHRDYARTRNDSCDDEQNHYVIHLGESLTPRYKILSLMGEGTFGKVVECWDRDQKRRLAIKIIRSIEKYRDAAMIEMDVLEAIRKHDQRNEKPIIQLLSWFDFRNHICMVFEKYGPSLFDFLKSNRYRPFHLKQIQDFGKQLLEGVSFMHGLTLIHTDLKPENILLKSSEYKVIRLPDSRADYRIPVSNEIKLIDMGSATFDSHHHTSIVSTRHYRAPEVILGIGWTYPCDIWSIGCILVELFTGDATFQTHENYEHLGLFEKTFGPIPKSLIEKADKHSQKYFHDNKLIWPGKNTKEDSIQHVRDQPTLKELIEPKNDNEESFYDLLTRLLVYDPDDRLTAADALDHPFFKCVIPFSIDGTLNPDDLIVPQKSITEFSNGKQEGK